MSSVRRRPSKICYRPGGSATGLWMDRTLTDLRIFLADSAAAREQQRITIPSDRETLVPHRTRSQLLKTATEPIATDTVKLAFLSRSIKTKAFLGEAGGPSRFQPVRPDGPRSGCGPFPRKLTLPDLLSFRRDGNNIGHDCAFSF